MIRLPTGLDTIRKDLRSGKLPLARYIDELEALFEEYEPGVQAFIDEESRFARLRSEADTLIEIYPDVEQRPALFGVPIGVKDIFHTDGFPTRAGSRLPVAALAGGQAESVNRLRQAGALILGKTITTEFAYFAPGPTHNPRNLDHTPGGSSSGSAASVVTGQTPLTLGTQTIGSVIRPAAFCGVVGFKPSYDRISREGVIPLSPSLDHVGLFTPDVAGAAAAAAILLENWQSMEAEETAKKPVLGVPEGPFFDQADANSQHQFRNICQRLIGKGYDVRFLAVMPDFESIQMRHNTIVAAEAARVHKDWYAEYKELYHPRTAALIEDGMQVSNGELAVASAGRYKLRKSLGETMRREGIDLWISPAAPGTAPKGLESTGDPVMNLPWTHSGMPAVTVPSGISEGGLPYGFQITARYGEDEFLLDQALDLETGVWPKTKVDAESESQ